MLLLSFDDDFFGGFVFVFVLGDDDVFVLSVEGGGDEGDLGSDGDGAD